MPGRHKLSVLNDTLGTGAKRSGVCILLATLLILGATGTTMAQTADAEAPDSPAGQVSLDELERYAVAYLEVRAQRVQLDREIGVLIARSGLSRERLYEIQEAGVDGIPEDDASEYRRVIERVETLQQRFRARMGAVVRQEDLTLERFNGITRALNADPDLAERAQAQLDRLFADRADMLGLDFDEDESGDQ